MLNLILGFIAGKASGEPDDVASPGYIDDNPSLSNVVLHNATPEICVDMLRHPSAKIYKNIHKRIIEADNEWMEVNAVFLHIHISSSCDIQIFRENLIRAASS